MVARKTRKQRKRSGILRSRSRVRYGYKKKAKTGSHLRSKF